MVLLHVVVMAFAVLLMAAVAVAIVWLKKPSLALRACVWVSIRRLGLRVRYVRGRQTVYCYAERGVPSDHQSTLVFVHGFSAGKDSWLGTIQKLPVDYHIIAVDLPGHGDSGLPSSSETACLQFMVDGLRELIVTAKINERPLHLIGTSMGGTVVGLYASQFPQDVDRLTLVCPCVRAPISSRYMLEYKKGINRLLPSNEQDLEQMFGALVYHKNRVPHNHQVLKALLQMQKPKAGFLEELFNSIAGTTKEELEKHLSLISAKTQVIWGANDEMIDVSGAAMLAQMVPTCQRMDIVPECGHSVDWDQPSAVADLLVTFRR